MGVNTDKYRNNDQKSKLIIKLSSIIKQNGVSQLKIDDITKYMDISKATFYKYFESKDDVIEHFVKLFVEDFIDLDNTINTENTLVDGQLYLTIFQKMLMQSIFGSQVFLNDIKYLYPELWEYIQLAIIKRNEILAQVYSYSMEGNILKKVNPGLLIIQDEIFFYQITQANFLVSRNISVKEAIIDYFELRVTQIFQNESSILPISKVIEESLQFLMQRLSLSSLG